VTSVWGGTLRGEELCVSNGVEDGTQHDTTSGVLC
jgi:hypothetical protein